MSILLLFLLLLPDAATSAAAAAAAASSDVAAIAQAQPAPTPTTPAPPTTTQPAADVPTPVAIGVGLFFVVLALVGATVARVFRSGSIRGPQRLDPATSPVLPILLILIIGGACWFGGSMLFFAIRAQQHMKQTGSSTFGLEQLQTGDLAFVATVPALIAMLVILAGDTMFALLRPIGLRVRQLPRSLLVGFGSGVIGILLVNGSSLLIGVLYELVNFQHPQEHELLGAMKKASEVEQMLLIFGACVMAPLFEELLFRGHMQTLLVRLFNRAMTPAPVPTPMMAPNVLPMPALGDAYAPQTMSAEAGTPPGVATPLPVPLPVLSLDFSAARWLAVIITSVVFALIHPLWTAPMIFILSIALGYVYERTGSLWVPIVMHAMFNISSTVVFLNVM